MQAVHRTAQVAVDARSEVRESYSAYRTAYDLAKHYRDEVVPLRKRISEETLLRYNGMLSSVFDLLADSRDQIASVTGYVESVRDFWVAQTDLQTALTGRSPGAGLGFGSPTAVMGSSAGAAH
jgi:outer membrane protein TolC